VFSKGYNSVFNDYIAEINICSFTYINFKLYTVTDLIFCFRQIKRYCYICIT
jgi:hypothetical protein